jgi:hypothetical protein
VRPAPPADGTGRRASRDCPACPFRPQSLALRGGRAAGRRWCRGHRSAGSGARRGGARPPVCASRRCLVGVGCGGSCAGGLGDGGRRGGVCRRYTSGLALVVPGGSVASHIADPPRGVLPSSSHSTRACGRRRPRGAGLCIQTAASGRVGGGSANRKSSQPTRRPAVAAIPSAASTKVARPATSGASCRLTVPRWERPIRARRAL